MTGYLVTEISDIAELVRGLRRVAVLGARPETHAHKAGFFVPQALALAGIEIIPVSVHDTQINTILGRQVYYRLADIPGPVDVVNVFRRPDQLPDHLADILALQPPAVWFQSGIRNDTVAGQLAAAGIRVVQDRCLMVDHRMFTARGWDARRSVTRIGS